MKALSDANTDALLWAPSADVAGHYELVSGEDVVALLIREKGWRKPTIARTLDGEWRIQRNHAWGVQISMWRPAAQENTAVYLPDSALAGPGRLVTTGNHRWQWREGYGIDTEWEFKDDTGRASIGFRTLPWVAGQEYDQVKVTPNAEALALLECLPLIILGRFLLWRQTEIIAATRQSAQLDTGSAFLDFIGFILEFIFRIFTH